MIETAPFYADVADAPEGAEACFLRTSDGTRLRVAVWSGGTRGTAILFPGRTEYIEKYGRVVGHLVRRGFSVLVLDWRGQGLSERHPSIPMLGHVADFQSYQIDVETILRHVAEIGLPRPLRLFAHSMGGCIGLRSVIEFDDFASVVLSAPMWDLPLGRATRDLAMRVTRVASLIGLGTRSMPGTDGAPMTLDSAFEDNSLTSDREQFVWALRQINLHPDLSLGGPSVLWTRAALTEMTRLRPALTSLPALGFMGTRERVVSKPAIREKFALLPQGELTILKQARHEIFQENAVFEEMVWARIDAFLTRLEAPAPS